MLQKNALDENNNELNENNDNANNNTSKQTLVGKKRIKKNLRKCYQVVQQLRDACKKFETIDILLPEKFCPFTGTMKMHQYTWNKQNHGLTLFNSLSCLDCLLGVICIHFSMGQISYGHNRLSLVSLEVQKDRIFKRSQKDTEVTSEVKKPKITPNVILQLKIIY
ncbi:hypothetical protein M0804_015176 [Polistes exclamans]|nr:hypothetical protein M0804_015176 [Polistes exclamans]